MHGEVVSDERPESYKHVCTDLKSLILDLYLDPKGLHVHWGSPINNIFSCIRKGVLNKM